MIKGLVGIVGFGTYLPYFRITTKEIAESWQRSFDPFVSLGVVEKTVPNFDEDTVTQSVEAALNALERAHLDPSRIDALYVGSESHPYAVKPSASIVGEAIGATPFLFSVDTEFACKAGTAAMQFTAGQVLSGMIDYGMAIGSDTAQGAPGDSLEYTAASGAAAFILGRKRSEIVAILRDTLSYTSDTPDFWRRSTEKYPVHGGRFTGEPAYFKHVTESTLAFLQKTKTKPSDYTYAIFHMPNGKFPRTVAKKLGFTEKQLEKSLVVEKIGNPYSASSMIGLSHVLEHAKPNESILMTSYGSGAGSDTFSFETTS